MESNEADVYSPVEHIFVGVDIGYTCTGVAILSLNEATNETTKPFPIQKWPGSDTRKRPDATNKVPTLVTYKAADVRARSWGFECPSSGQPNDGMLVIGLFKFLLDPDLLEELNKEKSGAEKEIIDNVKKWYTDFLTKLHEHIVSHLEGTWRVDWGVTKVEYLFSLPTKWEKKEGLVEEFGKIVSNAGFGSKENSSITIKLTEGVASAVYTAKILGSDFNEGDVLLVCDAGGGTTDICVLKVAKIDRMTVELETLEQISIFVGSVQIDEEFDQLFEEKLEVIENENRELLYGLVLEEPQARNAVKEQFRVIKMGWGIRSALRHIRFPLLGFPNELRVEFLDEINAMFDKQVGEIIAEIDKLLENLQRLGPGMDVVGASVIFQLKKKETLMATRKSRLILAGGLGSSVYVQSKLETHYNPKGLRILVEKNPEDPPLSVCRGLVLDRMQRVLHGNSVLRTRRCRVSYGILRDEIYSKARHKGRETFKKPADDRKYVLGCIRWFIRRGDIIAEDFEIELEHSRIASFGNPDTDWEDTIVTSKLPRDRLPQYLGQGGCRVVCKISSNAEPNSLTSKRKYLALGKRFLYGTYEVRGSVEQDCLRFETRVNGMTVGEGQTPLVPWEHI
ncbi:uncharacterized protein PAC_08138 [Phialocephala subalpina]|uniref:Hsp70 protein n=1 Tax=Phialocephala subalpina TaxID=576137 RepID=A0A1L7WZR3_9HELO|nr:uncharacterized protein PAC_08138 [Phialocephala subalpina]